MKAKSLFRLALLSSLLFAGAGVAAETVTIPTLQKDPALFALLPANIQKDGVMTSANSGSFPPYIIITGTNTLDGAAADLANSMGQVLGIKVDNVAVSGLPGMLAGIASGRFQMGVGPIGDFVDRQQKNDFVDFVQEFVVFAVYKGNPQKINSLADTCGKRISVMSGGSAEQVINKQSAACAKEGKPAITIQSFADQPTSILAVRSNRSDAFFSSQAPLTYFVQQTQGQLELAGVGQKNGFDTLYQGTVVPKNSQMGKAVLAAYQKLFDNGTYALIMKKWGLQNNMLPAPGINLAGAPPK